MSNVTLSIGGRSFTVACAEGEEDHITMLGRTIDERVRSVSGAAGQSESRMLLMGALVLADELHDARKNVGAAGSPSSGGSEAISGPLAKMAERMESLAEHLEKVATSA